MHPLRNHKSYLAAIGHRLSGIALAAFLPVHFFLLGTALEGAAELDAALALAELPLVKVAEWGLVMLLSLHLFFGLRVLALEFSDWPDHAETLSRWVLPGIIGSLLVGIVFLFNVF